MWRRSASAAATGLSGVGAVLLAASLFLTWSHQLSPIELAHFPGPVTYGVPADPTAWQVYAIAAEVLAVLAVGIIAAGLWAGRLGCGIALVATALGLAFVVHALGRAPTNGLLLASGSNNATRYVPDPARAGAGETVALIGLVLAAVGLIVGVLRPGTDPGGA